MPRDPYEAKWAAKSEVAFVDGFDRHLEKPSVLEPHRGVLEVAMPAEYRIVLCCS